MEVNNNADNGQKENLSGFIKEIYIKNRELNKQRIGFFTFLMNSAKAEIIFDRFQKVLFWNSLFDVFLFFISFCLFCSYASQFWPNIFFIGHAIRGVISILILKNLPTSSTIITNLDNFENESLQDIHYKIYEEFKKLLIQNEKRIKTLMYSYWIITVIDFLIDIIIFIVLLHNWGNKEYNFRNIATLIIIVLLFSKKIFLIFII